MLSQLSFHTITTWNETDQPQSGKRYASFLQRLHVNLLGEDFRQIKHLRFILAICHEAAHAILEHRETERAGRCNFLRLQRKGLSGTRLVDRTSCLL